MTLAVALVIAQPAQDLAPDYTQLVRDRRTLEALLADEQAVRDAVARHHNALALAWRAQATPRCRPDTAQIVARASALLRRHRRDAQSVRVRAKELGLVARAATVAPLVGLDESDALTRLIARAEAAVDAHLELRTWHQRYLSPLAPKCGGALEPGPGIGPSGARNAVLVIEEGAVVCPGPVAVREGVAVVGGAACVSLGACSCGARAVAPGAVLVVRTGTVAEG